MTKPSEITMETLRATPSVAVGTLTVIGIPLSDWVLILTSIYTVMQIIFLLRDKVWKQRKQKEEP